MTTEEWLDEIGVFIIPFIPVETEKVEDISYEEVQDIIDVNDIVEAQTHYPHAVVAEMLQKEKQNKNDVMNMIKYQAGIIKY